MPLWNKLSSWSCLWGMWDQFEPCHFNGRLPYLTMICSLESTIFTGKGEELQDLRSDFCVWAWLRLCPWTALCFSFCVCKMTWEAQVGAQRNLLLAPGAATAFPTSPLNNVAGPLLQIWLLFSFIGLVTSGTTLGVNGAMELLFKVITPYSKRHIRTVR